MKKLISMALCLFSMIFAEDISVNVSNNCQSTNANKVTTNVVIKNTSASNYRLNLIKDLSFLPKSYELSFNSADTVYTGDTVLVDVLANDSILLKIDIISKESKNVQEYVFANIKVENKVNNTFISNIVAGGIFNAEVLESNDIVFHVESSFAFIEQGDFTNVSSYVENTTTANKSYTIVKNIWQVLMV